MPAKHIQSRKVKKRKGRDIDEIQSDIIHKKEKVLDKEERLELPGFGKFFCKECERYFIHQESMDTHKRSKPHKNQVRRLKEPAYTMKDALIAGGMGTAS